MTLSKSVDIGSSPIRGAKIDNGVFSGSKLDSRRCPKQPKDYRGVKATREQYRLILTVHCLFITLKTKTMTTIKTNELNTSNNLL